MKEFMKDYVDLCKVTGRFYKKHWKGVVVMNVVVLGAEFAYIFREPIKDAIKEKFCKKEDEGLE